MTVALVLSGGGSRGSFEIGALEYLYEIGIWGEVICSTSVGSINGIKLAEGGSLQAQRTAFGELKQIWLEVQQNEDMYVPAPWLAGLSPQTLQALKSMMGLTTTDVLMALAWPSPFLLVDLMALGIDIDEVVGDIVNHRVRSLYELTPIQQKLQQRVNIQQVKTSGVTLRLAVVGLETGALRYVTEKGELLERDNKTLVPVPQGNTRGCEARQQALTDLENQREAVAKEVHNLDHTGGNKSAAVQESRRLEQEIQKARKALNECMRQHATLPATTTVDLIDGVLASATMPGYFLPVRLGDQTYVDGGVRELLPLQVALDLQPDHVIAISASSRGVKPRPSFAQADLLSTLERSLVEIAFDEIAEEEMNLARSAGKDITLIVPKIDMHDTIELDPGLIRIMIDYGYMRAADVVGVPAWLSGNTTLYATGTLTPVDPLSPPTSPTGGILSPVQPGVSPEIQQRREATADAIALCRWLSWELEHEANGVRRNNTSNGGGLVPVPSLQAFRRVRALKALIKALVMARKSIEGRIPANSEAWSTQFEVHPWTPLFATPWDHFINRAGEELPAAEIPRALLLKEQGRPEVFLIDGDTKYHVRDEAQLFRLTPDGWDAVNELPVGVLAGLRHAGDVTWV